MADDDDMDAMLARMSAATGNKPAAAAAVPAAKPKAAASAAAAKPVASTTNKPPALSTKPAVPGPQNTTPTAPKPGAQWTFKPTAGAGAAAPMAAAASKPSAAAVKPFAAASAASSSSSSSSASAADVSFDADSDDPMDRLLANAAAAAKAAAVPTAKKVVLASVPKSSTKCMPVFLAGSEAATDISVACPRIQCVACDHAVIRIPNASWDSKVEYLFLRLNYPDPNKLRPGLKKPAGAGGLGAAYCCQCSWASVSAARQTVEQSRNINPERTSLRWVCAGAH